MSKYTPGKWEEKDCKVSAIKIAKRRFDKPMIPICDKIQVELEIEANIRLIASAPELLLAAKESSLLLKEIADMCKVNCLKSPGFLNLIKAIANAEGK